MKGSEIVFELLVSRQHLQVLARNYCFPRPLEHKSTHVTRVSPPTDRAHRRVENCVTLMDRVVVPRVQYSRWREGFQFAFIGAIAAGDDAY